MNTPVSPANAGWLVSPAFDLVFVANLGWLAALLPAYLAADSTPHVEFWQLYFLTTPHRWITLVLVALDPDRREGRAWLFLLLAGLAGLLVAGLYAVAAGFICLLLVDYIWNGWHFAAQHAGVLRIYSRKAGIDRPLLERHGLRLFIGYTILRTAGWATGWLEGWPTALRVVDVIDLVLLGLPLTLVGTALLRGPWQPGYLSYLSSVCGLYAALLVSLHMQHRPLIVALTTAGALFHAVEYLALVSHYAWRRRDTGSPGVFRRLARHWLSFLAGYVIVLGLIAGLIHLTAGEAGTAWWVGINLWAAFLHYAYDGMIWKLRRPDTARALGAEAGP